MFKTILYPTDFSDVSRKALDYIKHLKGGGAETVILLHVIDQRAFNAIESYSTAHTDKLEMEIIEGVEEDLSSVEQELKQAGLKVKKMVKTGVPVREILNIEKEEDVSVIIIGSHGKSNLEEMFLGSVSEKVARKCIKPILIIKR